MASVIKAKSSGDLKALKCDERNHSRARAIAERHRLPMTRTVELLIDAWEGMAKREQIKVLTGVSRRKQRPAPRRAEKAGAHA